MIKVLGNEVLYHQSDSVTDTGISNSYSHWRMYTYKHTQGSKAADYAERICAGKKVAGSAAESMGYCLPVPGQPNKFEPSAAFKSLVEHDASADLTRAFEAAQRAVKQHVKGAMCGTSPSGLWTATYSSEFDALALAVKYNEDNDGAVELSSCMNPMGYDAQVSE